MSPNPAVRSMSSQMPSSGRPSIGIRHLGKTSVSGRSRDPIPAAASNAFITLLGAALMSGIDLGFDLVDAERQVADPADLTGRGQRAEIGALPDARANQQRHRGAGEEGVSRAGGIL